MEEGSMNTSWRWRMLVLLALVLLSAQVIVAIVFVFHNLFLLLAVIATAVTLALASWMVFSGTGRRYVLGWLLLLPSAALLVVEAAKLLARDRNMRLLIVMTLLSGAYLLLIAGLRRQYRQRHQKTVPTIVKHHMPVLIINPKSGDGRAIKADVPQHAKALGIGVVMLQKGDDVATIAQKSVDDGADILGISGGDGSLGAVAAVAIQHNLPLVVLPGGTRCHFARALGQDPQHINDALAGFQGVERRVDVGDINGRIFLNNASFGLYADIVDRPGYREHKVAATRTVLQNLAKEHSDLYDLQFTGPKNTHYTKAAAVFIGVNAYETQNLIDLGNRPYLDNGILQISAATALNDAMIRRVLLPTYPARKPGSIPNFFQWETTKFQITSQESTLVVGVDGEREEYQTPVTITLKPKALRLYVPPEEPQPKQRQLLGAEAFRLDDTGNR